MPKPFTTGHSAWSLRVASIVFSVFLILAAVGFANHAVAQSQTPDLASGETVDSINAEMREKLKDIGSRLEIFRNQVQTDQGDDAKLAKIRVQAETIIDEMRATSDAVKVRLGQIQSRITALGEPPKEGEPPEAPEVKEERARLTSERSQLMIIADDAGQLQTNATQLSTLITNMRRTLFAQTLLRHTELSGAFFSEAGDAFVKEVDVFGTTVGSWFSFVWQFKRLQFLGALALSIVAGLLFLSGGYRLFGRFISREGQEKPSYIRRLAVAFWSTVILTMSLAAFLVASFLSLEGFDVLRTDISPIVASVFGFVWFVYFVGKLTYAVLSPGQPEWRLVRITDRGARLLTWAVLAMAVVNGLDYLLGAISEALDSALVLTIAKSLLASVIIGLILIAISFVRPRVSETDDLYTTGQPWPRVVAISLRIMGVLLILAGITGYIGLARFASTQIVLTGAVAVLMYIGLLSGKAISKEGAFTDTIGGRWLTKRFGFGEVARDQAGLVAGLAIYVFALFLGIPLIMLTWGFQITDIEVWIVQLFTEIRIGSVSISLVGILGGILLGALGFIFTRWIQKWIDRNVLARSQVDIGVRNSVKTGIGYLGVGIAVIVGVSAAGINLSNLALVASALSVGIGFGLQNVVSNFVSGLILLVERPFKVGDYVVTGTTEGIVKRISVRATEIETFRKQTIIVPNSDLINAPVGNWTHKNSTQRSEIPVSVAYGTDPKRVTAILHEIAAEVPEILRNPEPHVDFAAFGASSLDFELRFHLADFSDGIRIRHGVRCAILERFAAEGIEIPYNRQDVMLLNPQFNAQVKKMPAVSDDSAEDSGDTAEK